MAAHPHTDFLKFIGTPLERWVLAIIPNYETTKLSDGSKLTKAHLGKIPGRYHRGTGKWSGCAWQEGWTKPADLRAWQQDQETTGTFAAGLRTKEYPAADTDSEDKPFCDEAAAILERHLGPSCCVRRRPNTERNVRFYKHKDGTAPILKFRLHVRKDGIDSVLEYLGDGQQVVQEGPHAKGDMHYWASGWDLVQAVTYGMLPEVTVEMVNAAFVELAKWCDDNGYERVKASLPTARDNATAFRTTDLTSPHIEADRDLLARAIQAIDLDADIMDYDGFIALLRAICASCAGDMKFFIDVLWPWVCTQKQARGSGPRSEERGIEWLEERWRSFTDSELGKNYVYRMAASFGFQEGLQAQAQELFANAPGPTGPAAGPAAELETAENDGGADAGGVEAPLGNGPLPYRDTHDALAALFIDQFGHEWRYNVDAKRWFKFDGRIWEPNDAVMDVIGAMVRPIAQDILNTVAGPTGVARNRSLLSYGTQNALCLWLQKTAALQAEECDFDQHHHLLNTPDGVINLRDGKLSPHDPALLLRNITLVSPGYNAMFDYERRCPKFFKVLANVAGARAHIIPAIRAWYAYTLTGDMRHQALMFLYGPPGVGKTVIAEVLFLLLGSHSKLIDKSFLSKNGGESKRFDMATIIGKRMLFMDETQLGMSWDETRMSKVGSARRLNAELKFGRAVEFDNTGKIFVVGNHKPKFVAADTGGLVSRMLLTEAVGTNYREKKNKGIDELARIIVEEEAEAILMWALEQSVADYANPELFGELTEDLKDASKEYAKEDSLMHQWLDSEMELADDLDIDQPDAIEAYLKFVERITGKKGHVTPSAFKSSLKAAAPSVEFDFFDELDGKRKQLKRTTWPHPNRAYYKGIGTPRGMAAALAGDNVIPMKPAAKDGS